VIHPITSQQYITDTGGQKTGVILSIEEYEQLLDDLHDLAVIAERRSETLISLEKMKEWLKEDGSLWNSVSAIDKNFYSLFFAQRIKYILC
jgi:hypothetical protein